MIKPRPIVDCGNPGATPPKAGTMYMNITNKYFNKYSFTVARVKDNIHEIQKVF
jgi:hypothetical protein